MVTYAAPEPAHHPEAYAHPTHRPFSATTDDIATFLHPSHCDPPPPATHAEAALALYSTKQGYSLVRGAKRALRVSVKQMESGKFKAAYRRLMRVEGELMVRMRALGVLVRSEGSGGRKRKARE